MNQIVIHRTIPHPTFDKPLRAEDRAPTDRTTCVHCTLTMERYGRFDPGLEERPCVRCRKLITYVFIEPEYADELMEKWQKQNGEKQ